VAEDDVQPEGNGTAVAPVVVPMKACVLPEGAPAPATWPELLMLNIITLCHPEGDWTAVTVYMEEAKAVVEAKNARKAVLRIAKL
jgi:hypothetical protein